MTEIEQLACDYHYNTERYDRYNCKQRSPHGTAIPSTPDEHQKININARQELLHALNKGKEMGFDTKTVQKAISEYAQVFNYEREHEYRERYRPNIIKSAYF